MAEDSGSGKLCNTHSTEKYWIRGGQGNVIRYNNIVGSDDHRFNAGIETFVNGDKDGGPMDVSCKRTTNNLSMSNPDLISILSSASFETRFEQYLMIREKHPQETRDEWEVTE